MDRYESCGKGARTAGPTLFACCIWLILGGVAFAQTPQAKAWDILESGLDEHTSGRRASAVTTLGVLPGNARATEFAENALIDKNPVVRAAAATALGEMGSKSSIPLLKQILKDKENRVFYAAADSLLLLGDHAGYDLYVEMLTGERKSGEGYFEEKRKLLTDHKALALVALGVGIGYAPYASYGWIVWREFSKDYVSPVKVNALKKLANDPDVRIGQALVKAASDKHPKVRVAALRALALHGDPKLIVAIEPHMMDKKPAVRYMAAAAVLRLSGANDIRSLEDQDQASVPIAAWMEPY